jgi:hypothetical protein
MPVLSASKFFNCHRSGLLRLFSATPEILVPLPHHHAGHIHTRRRSAGTAQAMCRLKQIFKI